LKFPVKQLKLISIIFFLLVYAAFLFYKIAKYNLFYYMHDMFSVMNTSCGWMFGHPLWWDNRYGFTPAIHFSFTAPLLLPFIIFFGGKGLFVFHALIYFMAFYFTIRDITDKNLLNITLAALVVFLVSPLGFWLFDDFSYGWHIELMLLPLAVFFALALISRKRWLIILSALLLVFTKEDGIVMACCVHVLFVLSENWDHKINWKKLLLITASWLAVFFIALFMIKYFGDFRETRLEQSLREFSEDTRFFTAAYFRKITWQFLILFLPLAAFCFCILKRIHFLKLMLLTLPLIITGVIAGLWYSGDVKLSVSWVPRFVEIMGVMLAGIIILLKKPGALKVIHYKTLAVVIVTVLLLQHIGLMEARNYNFFAEIKKAATHTLPENIHPDDERVIKCIAEKTPHDFNVAVPKEYFSAFDKNDLTWFGYYDNAPQKNPDMIILNDSTGFSEYKFDYDQYNTENKGKFFVLVKKEKMFGMGECN
jgi:hypothetical protein